MTDMNEFMKQASQTLDTAIKFKKVMIKKGLRRAQTQCPRCDGKLMGALHPNKRDASGFHLHFSCTGTCKTSYME